MGDSLITYRLNNVTACHYLAYLTFSVDRYNTDNYKLVVLHIDVCLSVLHTVL